MSDHQIQDPRGTLFLENPQKIHDSNVRDDAKKDTRAVDESRGAVSVDESEAVSEHALRQNEFAQTKMRT